MSSASSARSRAGRLRLGSCRSATTTATSCSSSSPPRAVSRRAPCSAASGSTSTGCFFALIDDDTLYFKADDASRQRYQAAGSRPFCPDRSRPEQAMGYWQVPAEVLEDPDELVAVGARSRGVALAKRGKRSARRRAPSRARGTAMSARADDAMARLRRDWEPQFSPVRRGPAECGSRPWADSPRTGGRDRDPARRGGGRAPRRRAARRLAARLRPRRQGLGRTRARIATRGGSCAAIPARKRAIRRPACRRFAMPSRRTAIPRASRRARSRRRWCRTRTGSTPSVRSASHAAWPSARPSGGRFTSRRTRFAASATPDDRGASVDHFYSKLLKLAGTMQTAAGRREAGRRTAFLEAFLAQLESEIAP